jgi:hypothetical protein
MTKQAKPGDYIPGVPKCTTTLAENNPEYYAKTQKVFHGERVAYVNYAGKRVVGKAFSENPEYVAVYDENRPDTFRRVRVTEVQELHDRDHGFVGTQQADYDSLHAKGRSLYDSLRHEKKTSHEDAFLAARQQFGLKHPLLRGIVPGIWVTFVGDDAKTYRGEFLGVIKAGDDEFYEIQVPGYPEANWVAVNSRSGWTVKVADREGK